MKLLFDHNLSHKLVGRLADLFSEADIEQALRSHHTDLLKFDASEEGAFLIVGNRRA